MLGIGIGMSDKSSRLDGRDGMGETRSTGHGRRFCERVYRGFAGGRDYCASAERRAYLLAFRIRSPYFQKRNGLCATFREHCHTQKGRRMCTYEGTPTAMAKHARIVSPLPYPSALYIAGANSGKPNPASERRKVAAARANQPKASARAHARRLRMGQVTYRKQRAVRMYR